MTEFYGSWIFLASIAASICVPILRRKIIRSELPSTTLATNMPPNVIVSPRKYETAILELVLPPVGPNRFQQLIQNDFALTKAVSEVSSSLYVYIRLGIGSDESCVSNYMSDLYERLWDEMLQQHSDLKLECFVSCDIPGFDYATKEQLFLNPKFQAIYTPFLNDAQTLCKLRGNKGLNPLRIEDISQSNTTKNEDTICFYFDSTELRVPSFKRVALGGTFDRLHNGHRKLLSLAAGVCLETLVIGITGDAMLSKKKNAAKIAKFPARKESVESFLSILKPSLCVHVAELQDPFGPAIVDPTIDAIVVSSETISGANKINDIRREKGLKPLIVLVTRRGSAAVLSSTFIREREQQSHTVE